MPTFDASDGTRLFYKDWGSGRPVVFVHAWSLSSAMWEYQTDALVEAGARCVAMDRRGHGRSDIPGTGYDLDTLADDLAALLERLDVRDATLVGHSMGTCEITRYLARHGTDRVTRAVYIGAMTPYLVGVVGPEFVDGLVAQLRADRPAWFRDGAPGYFATAGTPVSAAQLDDGIATILTTPFEVQVACLRQMLGTDLRADLAAVTVPTLVIHGDADASAPIDLTGRPTADLLPDATLTVYAGSGHGLYVGERDRLLRDLLAFGVVPALAGATSSP